VVFQFIVSATLILCTLIVQEQKDFIQSKDIGYEKDQLLVLRESYFLENDINAFKSKIAKDARVSSVSQSAFVPAGDTDNFVSSIYEGGKYSRRMIFYNIDEHYLNTMGMKLKEGRNFSSEYGSDDTNIIINETAAKTLGYSDNALGKSFVRDKGEFEEKLTVIGVVKDFHFKSLHQEIEPLVMMNRTYGGLIVKKWLMSSRYFLHSPFLLLV